MKPTSEGMGERDEDLMARVQKGDSEAFRTLYERHIRGVFGFVYRMVPDVQHTESIVHDAFLRLLRNAGSYRYPENFTTWFYTIARNLCIDFKRKKGSSAPALSETMERLTPGRSPDPLVAAADDEEVTRLRSAINELPEIYREVIMLRIFDKLPFKQISQIVQCPESTVRSRMGYALNMLRRKLKTGAA